MARGEDRREAEQRCIELRDQQPAGPARAIRLELGQVAVRDPIAGQQPRVERALGVLQLADALQHAVAVIWRAIANTDPGAFG